MVDQTEVEVSTCNPLSCSSHEKLEACFCELQLFLFFISSIVRSSFQLLIDLLCVGEGCKGMSLLSQYHKVRVELYCLVEKLGRQVFQCHSSLCHLLLLFKTFSLRMEVVDVEQIVIGAGILTRVFKKHLGHFWLRRNISTSAICSNS